MKMCDDINPRVPLLRATQPEESPPRRYTPWPPERDGERGVTWEEAVAAIEESTATAAPWYRRLTRRG